MSGKKLFAAAVISAAVIYGSYAAAKKYVVEPLREQRQTAESLVSRVGYLEGLLDTVSKENYEYFRGQLESDQKFVDSVVKKAVSNNPDYVISLLPENKRAEYVNSNYNFLSDANKKEVALDYAKGEIKKVRKDVDEFFDITYEKAKKLEENTSGRLINLKIKIDETIRDILR